MADEGVNTQCEVPRNETDYEPPAVFDFGHIFTITHGNANGSGDESAQRYN
ncbi:hypothetical protein EV192_10523 [Actinocrispum wychmicini]|uniref:Lasso RiPP family leader peptide-containing protein n=1 Tax=Actinocrispum wychmicini TaxID=1213861 RepID=A0A4R2JE89_9PSEU|nr:hypothetical protein EV192_10523 [Actinocrispum wychmicini]